MEQREWKTLVELVMHRAVAEPERIAYTFLLEHGREERCSYGELDAAARGMAAVLQQQHTAGQRALLLYPPGLDYLYAFFGCLYAGILPVPAYPPRSNGHLTRLQAIVADAQASAALTTPEILQGVQSRLAELPGLAKLAWMAPDRETVRMQRTAWQPVQTERASLAFLQYTSGSTALPKGVMLTHENLLHNLELMQQKFRTSTDSRCVIWLPPYHDMGLIGGILQPLYTGYPVTLMAPVDFIQKPLRWLELITATRATVSGGPNFAYDLCVQKISPEQRDGLDLSSWEVAFSGAEPVRAATLARFAEVFGSCGFQERAFYPCYGLAEGTLFAAGGVQGQAPVVRSFAGAALLEKCAVPVAEEQEGDRRLVSSGRALESGQRIIIADPQGGTACPEGQVGEIWLSGPSVAQGYWQREAQTAETFGARLAGADAAESTFLRTGDLGFVWEGELYVTGRLKDLLILRGRNYYPQDIEQTVQESHPAVHNGNGAAFSVEVDGEERLVIVQEVERSHRRSNLAEVAAEIRKRVSQEHSLQAADIVLLRPMSIPKTTSGKVQRHACRNRYLERTLDVLYADRPILTLETAATAEVAEEAVLTRDVLADMDEPARRHALTLLLAQTAARAMRVPLQEVLQAGSLDLLGLDSLMAAEIKQELEERLHVNLPFARLLGGASLDELAGEVGAQLMQREDGDGRIANEAEELPSGAVALTHGQRAMWLLQRMEPQSAAYQIAKAVRVGQALDAELLAVAFAELCKRHPLLRAAMQDGADGPEMMVHAEPVAPWQVEDVTGLSDDELRSRLQEEAVRPFALEGEALVRARLYRREDEPSVLLLILHHIVCDFWSLGLMMQELTALYAALRDGAAADLPAPKRSFAGFAKEQALRLAGSRREELAAFWQSQLGAELPVLDLPADYPRRPVQTHRGSALAFRFSAEDSLRLKAYAKRQGVTMNMLFLAAYLLLLHRYTGQETVAVGTPAAGRTGLQDARTIGYFVNPVVQRADFDDRELTFAGLLAQVRQGVTLSLEHQDLPFPLLVDLLQPKRDPAHPPLFQTLFTYQTSPLRELPGLSGWALGLDGVAVDSGELALESFALPLQTVQYELELSAAETEGRYCGVFAYNADLYLPETVERMMQSYQHLLLAAVEEDACPVGALPLYNAEQQEQLLLAGLGAETMPQEQRWMHARFERHAQSAPQRTALVFEAETLTYAELNARANRLAHRLRRLGVGAETPVGVCLRRSPELLIALLAVLKAGGMYVPLDPDYPAERIAYMLADCRASVVLTTEDLQALLPTPACETVCVDNPAAFLSEPAENLPAVSTEQAAYLIYTSGSTGRPKGVVVTHGNTAHFYAGMDERIGCTASDALLAVTSICFDISVLELFWTLASGAKVILLSEQEAKGAGGGRYSLQSQARAHGATLLQCTPSLARLTFADHETVQALQGLRALLLGGEALSAQQAADICSRLPDVQLFNMYGPTEATVWAVAQRVADVQGAIPIGRSLAGVRAYVLDERLQPVPFGVAGELHLGGAGIARGYFGRPELTAERFLPDPFADGRMYKTGDAVRMKRDGTLEFLGRLDQQVKVRGYRIELEEIEHVLGEHERVREAVCAAQASSLVAYVVAEERDGLQVELFELLKRRLPGYMVPDHLLFLERLPLTPNGKTDKKALPVPALDRSRAAAVFAPPGNETERQIAAAWQEVLGSAQVGIDDSFFEVGGNSLKLEQVYSRLQPILPKTISIADLFRYPTVRLLAERIAASGAEQQATAAEAQDRGSARREAMQRRRGKR
ncbi:amino acid adenylation domain-containing protein [Tumebacillus sp. BK434]|uniref:non-ribosomal peptide synthetase n=1 Tax=Tumebacillus sp. BK434 TaxID=2512169 RepID=UPI0010E6A6C0|nr:non-ribosomal peptide synthetase [Tumebacillus sp. BK434]TCP59318.1 amino acid adenylation domain-containing protein [Tumebacillus sp. BK434]